MRAIFYHLTFLFASTQGFFQGFPFPQTSFDDALARLSQQSNLHKPQCVQQMVDIDTLNKVVSKLINDIPNICLSRFKMCGGFQAPPPAQQGPLPEFFRSANIPNPEQNPGEFSEEGFVDEMFEDSENGTETKTDKSRQRRSATHPHYGQHYHSYGGYGGGHGYNQPQTYGSGGGYGYNQPQTYGSGGGYGYGSGGSYGYNQPQSYGGYNYYQPPPIYYNSLENRVVNLYDQFKQNPAFFDAYAGFEYNRDNPERKTVVVN